MYKVLGLLIILLSSNACKQINEFDAETAAKEYCDCLERNNASKDYLNARIICEGEQISKNKYFRAFYIEAHYGRYLFLQQPSFADSVAKFHLQFANTLQDYCCKISIEGCDTSNLMYKARKLADTISLK
ncbi:hypothetical protein [Pseudoflavitalea rhizosphaerae]|uniref:hypothetical protein n=1 Tax=Pseudoflavitalea rhizosphaerae TaxID=1884793 RepID=UPI000F8E73A1|nr:hypothetical protein [Pseudoflavitalea rhizosphaerae]